MKKLVVYLNKDSAGNFNISKGIINAPGFFEIIRNESLRNPSAIIDRPRIVPEMCLHYTLRMAQCDFMFFYLIDRSCTEINFENS